jgi:hypothetical protein
MIGPTFGAEVLAAGLGGLPFAWGEDGAISGRENLTAGQNAALDAALAAHDPAKQAVPQVISDRQFFQQLAVQAVITEDDAIAAVATGTLPVSMDQIIATLPLDQQFGAKMLLKGATQFDRQHPMVAVLGGALGWNSAQLDALWTGAAVL